MVSQRWIGEGVGRVHIVEIPKLGYVLGVAEKFPRYMAENANMVYGSCVMYHHRD
jgi:hypothetical protein